MSINEIIKELSKLFQEGIDKVTQLTVINRESVMNNDLRINRLTNRVEELERRLNEAEDYAREQAE